MTMTMSHDPEQIDKFLDDLEIKLLKRCNYYVRNFNLKTCPASKVALASLGYEPFNLSFSALKEAIVHIRMDIKILLMRRDKLIGDLRMSEGKIAGVITYRLAKAHIIHIHRKCNICGPQCFARRNSELAIFLGIDHIHKKYSELLPGIRKELLYTIMYRHINQETLGLVYDTINGTCIDK